MKKKIKLNKEELKRQMKNLIKTLRKINQNLKSLL